MNQEIIKKIIEAGNLAPSGSNSQSWKFKVSQNKLTVYLLPEKDHPVLNFDKRGTYIAHGALLENIEIASRYFGYKPEYEILPEENISFNIVFEESESKTEEIENLYQAIFSRCSNRKPFKKDQLSQEQIDYLFQEKNKYPQCEVIYFTDNNQIQEIAKYLPFDILVFLRNKLLHQLLFKEILWKEEEQKVKPGLYIKTMEVPPPAVLIFKLLSNWKICNLLSKIHEKIYEQSIKTASSAGLIGAIVAENKSSNFIYVGRLLENIWLRATKLNLGFQFISGIVFLWQQLNFGNKEIFSEKDKEIIDNAYNNLAKLLGLEDKNNKVIAGFFRVGFADKPSAVSYKRPPEIE